MKGRLIIFALGLSEPGTMGGNSKIALEMARNLAPSMEVHFILPQYKLPTFTSTLGENSGVRVHALKDFPLKDKYHPVKSVLHYLPQVRELFCELSLGREDVVFGMSDFHVDVLPLYWLQKEFGFCHLPSVFLFVPGVIENLRQGYGFPVFKYFLYRIYQRFLFALMRLSATGFVITNDIDRARFPPKFANRIFAYYGGVNVEEIPTGKIAPTRELVFCSRLHPQKGIGKFLDVWKVVHEQLPRARFTVIGNGDEAYTRWLRAKAARLGLGDSIEWLGYVNHAAKYRIYRESKIFVHPTVYDNNGMVAAEALCSGLPVVMYDLPALQKVYTTGCVKVPIGNTRAFAEELVRLLRDDEARSAVAPSPAQVAQLQRKWAWPCRARLFAEWLEKVT